MKSWILSVGDEVLSGKTINTNFSTISSYLSKIGIDVWFKLMIIRVSMKNGNNAGTTLITHTLRPFVVACIQF